MRVVAAVAADSELRFRALLSAGGRGRLRVRVVAALAADSELRRRARASLEPRPPTDGSESSP